MKRVRNCGRCATGDTVTVRVSELGDGNKAGLGGVQSCGSVWACPVCSEKVNAGRQAELEAGIRAFLAAGGFVLFGTLTLRHNKGHRLGELWDAIGPAWNRTTSGAGKAWNGGKTDQGDKVRFGIEGYVRVVETKHGQNGWHPHVHFLLFCTNPLSRQQIADLQARMFGRWERALADRGLSVLQSVGIDLRPVKADHELARYFTKATYAGAAAYEVTGSHSKRQGKGGRAPFDILRDVVADGDEEDLALWHEWEKASKGRRQLTWSRGLRAILALGAEKSDQELVEDDHGGEIVATIAAGDYKAIASAGLVPQLLEMAEASPHRVRLLLDSWGCLRPTEFQHRE